ncbi:MAG: hypothetical protein AAGE52_00590 [Myxococcota bacterium]
MGASEHPALERSTSPIPPASGREVWVATWDVGGLRRLRLRLHGRADVRPVDDLRMLARANGSVTVVLDACAPGVDALEAAPLLNGSYAMVIVWGASPELREALAAEPGTRGWMHVPNDTTSRELAEILSSLF